MISASAMGIIFPNMHDQNIPELVGHRTMASIPFAGRYRMIDFTLSAMTRAGVKNIGVIAQKNFQSLMDHLGNGREWDLSSKRGGLVLFPPYARGNEMYSGRIEMLASVLDYIEARREGLVLMSDCNIAFNMDVAGLLDAHMKSGADITMVYHKCDITEEMQKDNVVLGLDEDGMVTDLRLNEYKKGVANLSMDVMVIGREFLINVVRECMVRGYDQFTRDYLARSLKLVKVRGHEYTGYAAHIHDMGSYYRESLRLLDHRNLTALFPTGQPVYTKVRDEAPVRYAIDSAVSRCLVADGCIIEGEVEDCVLFRGVRIGKGARLKGCVIMQGTEVEPGVVMENVITDKNVCVTAGQALRGAASFPVFIAKGCVVT